MTLFRNVHHICIAVEDIDPVIDFYESVGIGPWHDYPPLTAFTDIAVGSVEGFHRLIYKWTMIGALQLQLVQPGGGRTPQRDFLDEHGPGVYHVGFVVDDADAAERDAAALGLHTAARGRRPDGSGFTYFQTRSRGGVTLEIRQSPPTRTLAPGADAVSQPSDAAVTAMPFRKAHHFCVAVWDIERAVAFYDSVGIGPWQRLAPMTELTELAAASAQAVHDLSYRWTTVGGLQLHLVQPGSGQTPQSHFLQAHGEGVFHIGFTVDSVDEAEADAAALGLHVIMRGRRVDRSGFSYFDTYSQAGVTLQVHQTGAPRESGALE